MRRSAHLYDLINETFKDYAAEAQTLHGLIQQHSRSTAATSTSGILAACRAAAVAIRVTAAAVAETATEATSPRRFIM
jgi:hypothetical protein